MAFGAPAGVTPDGTNPGTDQQGGAGGVDVSCTCSAGEPVNPATGDYYDTKTDLTIPGAGIPLSFTRTYDAEAAQVEDSAAAPAGPLGYGWTDNLSMSDSYNSGTGLATITQANGSQITFQYYAQGATEPVGSNGVTWCPSDATAAVFCPTAPRYIATLTQNVGGIWTFVNDVKSPITYTFTSTGVLSEVADAAGDTLVGSAYSPGAGQVACPGGDTCTAWSSTPSGESSPTAVLAEAFNSSSQLVSVFDAASAAASAQVATFFYSGSGCSTWSGTPADLCSVTDPGSLTTTFNYDTGKSSPYQYDEVMMNPPATGQVSNTYNSSGQISKQIITTGGTNQEQDFAYAANSTVANGTDSTVTSYPNGSGGTSTTTSYLYSNGVEVGETDGAGATTYVNRDPATLLAVNAIDGNGNDTSNLLDNYASYGGTPTSSADATQTTDGDGNTTQTEYTAANLPWCSVDAADAADRISCPYPEPTSPPSPGTRIGYTLDIYNAANQVIFTTDPLGSTTANSYTTSGSGVPAGLLYCTVDPVNYANGVTCPAYGAAHVTGTATKTFDAEGDVLTTTDPHGDVTGYVYGSAANPGLPTVTTDPDGKVTTDTYNSQGEILTQVATDTSGSYSATTQYAYDTAGRKFCEVDPFEYSQSVRCPSTPPTSPPTGTPGYTDTIYNSNGQVASTTNPIGGTTQYGYDGSGNKYCTVSAFDYANATRCPTALPLTTPTTSSDPYLGATIDTFDAANRVIQETNPLGGITLKVYDADSNLTQQTVESNSSSSAPNIVTATTYDADDRAISSTAGVGTSNPATTLTNYDPNGDAFCTVSANADAAGSSTYQCPTWQAGWIATPPSPATLYSTSPSASQANNVTTTFFNADGTQVQSTNPDVETTMTSNDPDGRSYCTVDPVNVNAGVSCPAVGASHVTGTSTTVYDPAGRILSTTDQLGDTTSSTFDAVGNKLTTTDPRGKVTTNCYYGQNGTGQCAASAPAGGGSFDDLYSTTTPPTAADPSGGTTTYQYYPGDQASVTVSPGGSIWDIPDASGDVVNAVNFSPQTGYAGAGTVSYSYNADSSRHTMTDLTGTTTYGYDANGNVTSQAFTPATNTSMSANTVDYSYFTTGALQKVTYPSSGSNTPTATYTYDGRGDMTSVTDGLGHQTNFLTDGDGNNTGQLNNVSGSAPYGTSLTLPTYDAADQNTASTSYLGSSCTLTQSFSGSTGSRNADNQVTGDNETSTSCPISTSYQRNYSYDQAGRVVYQGSSAQGLSPNNVTFDPSGNPTEISSHDSSGNFDTYTQTFDNAGEVLGQTPVSGSQGSPSTYSYDTLGDQTSSVTGSTTTTYGYNQLGQMSSTSSTGPSYLYTGDGLETAKIAAPSWGNPINVDSTRTIESVSCPSSTFCAAVDHLGRAITYNGTNWSSVSDIDGTKSINAVSCVSSSFCDAVDSAGQVLTYNGTSWSSGTTIDASNHLDSVSCPTTSFCVAVDNDGNAFTYNGTSWSGGTSINSTRPINGVFCTSSTFCAAVANNGKAFTYNGTSWSAASDIDGGNGINSVSCASSSFCKAVDAAGNVLTYSGTSWSTATNIDGTNVLESVSCPSVSFCVAVDGSGHALTFTGSSWSAAVDIDGTHTLDSVFCASANLCAAVDSVGSAVVMKRPVIAQLVWNTNGSIPITLSDGTNDYIYGPTGEPVEQVNVTSSPPTNNPVFMTYTPSDSSWVIANAAGTETNFYRYDAFGNLAYGTAGSPFGYAGQYQDAGTGSTGFDNMRARWYDSQTGEFTTRDPAFSQTDQAYAYAGDDPVNQTDPSGKATVGICANGNGQFGLVNIDPNLCLTRTIDRSGEDDIGLVSTLGVGAGIGADVSVGISYEVTNATNLHQLSGWFTYFNVALDIGGGANATLFWNDNDTIRGANFGFSIGGGALVALGRSYTRVDQFNGTILANTARGVWDAFNPDIAIAQVLARATSRINQIRDTSSEAIPSGGASGTGLTGNVCQ